MAALVGQEYAPGTLERYKTPYKHTQSFLEWKYKLKDIDITKLNFEFIHTIITCCIRNFRKLSGTSQCKFQDKLLPVLSNQKMNSYLKEIADVCGINKNLTYHIARHTFATTLTLSNGVPIETISKMLGHTNLKTTQHF